MGVPTLSAEEVGAYVNAKTPLAFWRHRAGLTHARLAKMVGMSGVLIAQYESEYWASVSKILCHQDPRLRAYVFRLDGDRAL